MQDQHLLQNGVKRAAVQGSLVAESVVTDGAGQAVVPGGPAGQYSVVVSRPGYHTLLPSSLLLDCSPATNCSCRAELELELQQQSCAGENRTVTITVRYETVTSIQNDNTFCIDFAIDENV